MPVVDPVAAVPLPQVLFAEAVDVPVPVILPPSSVVCPAPRRADCAAQRHQDDNDGASETPCVLMSTHCSSFPPASGFARAAPVMGGLEGPPPIGRWNGRLSPDLVGLEAPRGPRRKAPDSTAMRTALFPDYGARGGGGGGSAGGTDAPGIGE